MSWYDFFTPGGNSYDEQAGKTNWNNTVTGNTQDAANYAVQNDHIAGQAATDAATNYYGTANQVYGQQQQAAQMLQNQANGTAPSAANIQMQQGLGQANQQAQSAALSQQGGVLSGNTQRNMLNAQAANSQGIIGQTASQRATDQLNAQNAYSNLLGGMQTQQQALGTAQYHQGQDYLTTQQNLAKSTLDANNNARNTNYNDTNSYLTGQADRNNGRVAGAQAFVGKAASLIPGF